jgi:hypothetical protein
MNELLQKLLIPIILVAAGILLKKGYIPNTKSEGKLWLALVIVGCVGIILDLLLVLISS